MERSVDRRRNRPRLIMALAVLAVAAPFLLVPASSSQVTGVPGLEGLAPAEVVAVLSEPTGVAVDAQGAVAVSDRKAGVVYQVTAGSLQPLAVRLGSPAGIAFDGAGRLLIVEEKTGRLVRLDGTAITVLAEGMRTPRWLAVAADGAIYVSARSARREVERDEDEEGDGIEGKGEMVLRLDPAGRLSVWADGFRGVEGLIAHGDAVLAAARGRGREAAGIFEITVEDDGSAGPVTRLSTSPLDQPMGLARDALGALYASAARVGAGRTAAPRAIAKSHDGSALAPFAWKLEKPRGIAFDAGGNLYVADGTGRAGRLLRFLAPAPPSVPSTIFTGQNPGALSGVTDPQARVDLVSGETVIDSAVTESGAFTLSATLQGNAPNGFAVYATAHRGAGLTSGPAAGTIIHDGGAPAITNLAPANGAFRNTAQPAMGATFSDVLAGIDPASAIVRLDGASVTAQARITAAGFSLTPAPLAEGGHTIFVQVADRAGHVTSASAAFVIDVTGPSITGLTPADGSTVTTTRPAISAGLADAGSGIEPATLQIMLDGVDRTGAAGVTPDGFTLDPGDLAAGAHTVSIAVADRAGNVATATASFTVGTVAPPPGGGLPPDPVTVAPPLDPTVPTSTFKATEFLHAGPDPIQTGVAASEIDPRRVAVLRGQVLGRDGLPLPGVRVSVLNTAALGQTLSRADGMFDLAVNGGGPVTVTFERAGFLPVQRTVDVREREFGPVPDVVMVPFDTQVTAIDLTSDAAIQVARGSLVTDPLGVRQPTLFFRQGTTAAMVIPGRAPQPLSTLNVRATEFTVGPNGRAALPGTLPANVSFVTSTEYTVDEAVAAGATEVLFSPPVINYVENIVGIPTGDTVPMAFYDRTRGVWVPEDDGRAIEILSVAGGLAEVDTDGDGLADNGVSLGMTAAERQHLAALYQPGQTLTRRLLSHFTPFG